MTATVRGISPGERSGSIDKDGVREYSVTYKVVTDNKKDGPGIVRTAFGIPNIGDLYAPGNEFDYAAVVVNKTVSETESPWEWTVEVTYSTKVDDNGQEQPPVDNPLNQMPEISYGFQARMVLIPGRYNDPENAINAAVVDRGIFLPNGELLNPQPTIEINEPIMTVRRNVATFSGPAMMAIANAVNSDYWQGAEPRQLRLLAPQATSKYHSSCGVYWEVTYQIAYRFETWDVTFLNEGSFYFASAAPLAVWSSTLRRLVKTDDNGNVIVVNLTTDGRINTTAVPTFTTLRVYREINFSSLGII